MKKKFEFARNWLVGLLMVSMLVSVAGCAREPRQTNETGEETKTTTIGQVQDETKPLETEAAFEPGRHWPVPVGTSVGDGMLFGYMDATDKWIIEPKYVSAGAFDPNGLAQVSQDYDQNGVIDLEGNELLQPIYDNVTVSEGIIVAHQYDGEGAATSLAYDLKGMALFKISGYLNAFSEGLAFVYGEGENGFVDNSGEIVIPLEQSYSTGFENGKARIEAYNETPSYWIDKKGNPIKGDMVIYTEMHEDIAYYGYQDAQGNRITDAIYVSAEPFSGKLAIVGVGSDTYNMRMGLINEKGDLVVPAEYCGIKALSNGLFAVGIAIGADAYAPYNYIDYSELALFGPDGKQLSDWIFTGITNVDDELVQVSNDRLTYFVGKDGQELKDMPSFAGVGEMALVNGYWFGFLNGQQTLADVDGKTLVEVNPRIILKEGFELTSFIAKANRFDNVQYPKISGMKDAVVQDKINQRIYETMGNIYAEDYTEGGITFYTITDGSYRAWTKGNLLIIEQDSYSYPLGAAHGMPYRTDLYFDLTTGEDFTLDDLLLEADREEAYSMMSLEVSRQMVENMEEQGYWDDHAQVPYDAPFRLMNDGYTLYFMPYELASYANGFTEFPITFELMDVYINKEGAFWKALSGS